MVTVSTKTMPFRLRGIRDVYNLYFGHKQGSEQDVDIGSFP